MTAIVMLSLSAAAYLAAFFLHLGSFRDPAARTHRPGFALMRVGFLLATFYLVTEAVRRGAFLPIAGMSEALAFFAWSLAFVYLVLLVSAQIDSFGLILTPVLLLFTAVAALTAVPGSGGYQVPPNPVFMLHILAAYFAYASLTISFVAGILFLIQSRELKARRAGTFYHKLPSLESLENLIYQPMIWGASLLLAAVILGFVWSLTAFGELWLLDPKTLAASATSLFYFFILCLRYRASLRARKGALLALAAFALVIFSFVGTRFIEGSHDYLRGT